MGLQTNHPLLGLKPSAPGWANGNFCPSWMMNFFSLKNGLDFLHFLESLDIRVYFAAPRHVWCRFRLCTLLLSTRIKGEWSVVVQELAPFGLADYIHTEVIICRINWLYIFQILWYYFLYTMMYWWMMHWCISHLVVSLLIGNGSGVSIDAHSSSTCPAFVLNLPSYFVVCDLWKCQPKQMYHELSCPVSMKSDWYCWWNLVNDRINYQPQLVSWISEPSTSMNTGRFFVSLRALHAFSRTLRLCKMLACKQLLSFSVHRSAAGFIG